MILVNTSEMALIRENSAAEYSRGNRKLVYYTILKEKKPHVDQ